MFGFYFILIVALLLLTVINLPFILFYLYFFLNRFFTTDDPLDCFEAVEEAVNKKLSPALDLLLFPYKTVVLACSLILMLRVYLILILVLIMIYFVFSVYIDELYKMFEFLNWGFLDILFFGFGFGYLILLTLSFIKEAQDRAVILSKNEILKEMTDSN